VTDTDTDLLPELGFYGLAGHTDSPGDLLDECRQAEALGLGSVFVSERFNVKEAASLTGAAAAVTTTLGVATGVTNHTTRHPLLTATWGATVHRLSHGRFALGIGRGFDFLFDAIGAPRVTSAAMADVIDIWRRLWAGETIFGHDGPAGTYPYLSLGADFDEDIPILMAALGPKTLRFAGAHCDGVILHTFICDEALERCVAAIRQGAEEAGRDPERVRIWSVLATVADRSEEDQLRSVTGRLATYFQAYGDLLVSLNDWDPAPLAAFRADEVVGSIGGAIDAVATPDQLRHIRDLLPAEWVGASAIGTPAECAARIVDQFGAGADGVICHAATPPQLASMLATYRQIRPADRFTGRSTNPGR